MIKIDQKHFPVSYSQYRIYNECPAKYKFKYVDGLKEPSNPNLELGTNIHKLCENQVWSMRLLCKEEQDKVAAQVNKFYLEQLLNELEDFFNDKIVYCNELNLRDDDYTAKIDVVYANAQSPNDIILADFKVTKKPKTTDSMVEEEQLLFYKDMFNRFSDKINLQFLSESIKPKSIKVQYINILPYNAPKILSYTDIIEFTDLRCHQVTAYIDETVEKINNGEFPKKKKWCNWCFFKDLCNK